jgi:hypothetical protein
MARFDDWSKEDLAWKCRELCDQVEDLKSENGKQHGEIQHLKFRIEQELEPRIKAEGRSYDRWISNPERR